MRLAIRHGTHRASAIRLVLTVALLAGALALPNSPSTHAATLVVANTNDTGANSLRQAILDAGSGDTITFDASLSGMTITLLSPLSLTKNLTIDGSALAEPVTLSGNGAVRVLEVTSGTTVTLQGLVIADGMADEDGGGTAPGYGGGIYSLGALTVVDCTFSDNSADWAGGAIYTMHESAVLTVTRCTFTGNSAGSGGGGIFAMPLVSITDSTFSDNSGGEGGGAAYAVGTVTVANSTFSGNIASAGGALASYMMLTVENSTFSGNVASGGGGIWFATGSLTLSHCTFSGNAASPLDRGGGAILIGDGLHDVELNYTHTILADSVGEDCRLDGDASVVLNAYNLVEDGTCGAGLSGDPKLGPLADNGGPTHTMALLPGSPALNAGDADTCPAPTDQRGVVRPQGAGCDLGAYEMELPAVATESATAVQGTGATLRGTVNARGNEAAVCFEYGPDAGYGMTVTVPSPVAGTVDAAVSAAVNGLTPNATYHYRLVAENAAGVAYGADRTLFTAAPPAASTLAADEVTSMGAVLHGVVNALNSSATVTFEYGLDDDYGAGTEAAAPSPVTGMLDTAVSAVLTGLAPNTTYHYRVVAENGAGTGYGTDRTLITEAIAPTAVTGAASAVTATGATLHGSVNAHNSTTTVTFAYGLTAGYGMSATVPSAVTGTLDTAVSAALTGLIPGTTYHYRVVADNGAGTTAGEDATFTTDDTAPSATTDPATDISITGATLRGTVNANNNTAAVQFWIGKTTDYGTVVTAVPSPVTGTTDTAVSYTLTDLAPATTYHYRVVAVSDGGLGGGADATFTTLPLRDLYLPAIRR